jgi:hypothetical protein
VSTKICKRLVYHDKLVLSSGYWCLQISVRYWCLLLSWFLAVGIGVSSRLVSTKICKSRLVPTGICTSGDLCLQ